MDHLTTRQSENKRLSQPDYLARCGQRTVLMQRAERSIYTAQDLLQWRETKTLALTPKFQRRGVWRLAARSYFIDTLLKDMPVPPIYIRVIQSTHTTGIVREVVDGQQRISCMLDFIDNKFRLAKSADPLWAGKPFNELAPALKQKILSYGFSSEVFRGLSDQEVLEIFARLNTYSVPLNAQELRNGKYFGFFKQCSYSLAHEHLEFWRRNKIFTEQNIARMIEVEATSEMLIASLEGMQDKKKSIDSFYEELDEEFPAQDKTLRQFRMVIDVISETLSDTLSRSEFRRPPLFYTLFCAVFHRIYGLPNTTLRSPQKRLDRSERLSLSAAGEQLSELIVRGRANEPIPKKFDAFVASCLRQTDNLRPRQERFRVLYETAFS